MIDGNGYLLDHGVMSSKGIFEIIEAVKMGIKRAKRLIGRESWLWDTVSRYGNVDGIARTFLVLPRSIPWSASQWC